MPFPRKLLNDDEDVILDLRPHWSTLAEPVLALALAAGAMIALRVGTTRLVHGWLWVGGAAATVFFLGWFVVRYLRWATTNFVVTNDRIVYRVGTLAKRGKEIPLERVNDIGFRQSIWERLIGTGDLSIESAGAQSRETFANIPRPSVVQNEIYRQMEASAARHADRMAGSRELSIPEQIDKLDDLRQRGVISQAEFEVKKQQLLERM